MPDDNTQELLDKIKSLEKELNKAKRYDTLTRLYNRKGLCGSVSGY